MIRLSEAVAKLHCTSVIDIKHVLEAVNLLKKSIVKVEGDDVIFDDETDTADDLSAQPSQEPQTMGLDTVDVANMDIESAHFIGQQEVILCALGSVFLKANI